MLVVLQMATYGSDRGACTAECKILFLGMTTLPTEALHDVPLCVPFWPSRRGL